MADVAYPVMKEAAAFFMDYMTVHPKYGWLVTGPSNSPENSFYTDNREEGHQQLSMGPTTCIRYWSGICWSSACRRHRRSTRITSCSRHGSRRWISCPRCW
ncbi:glycosyl hydrolase family 95 catalytic domain-containing protein [Paenibacillus uliginis]|uniref:glycosyl hydrolase family 95 catalytic domain-containing protein n=1 Tax=Paenibacillus uliginis TaxID=683737 RepID=UPI003CC7DF39